MQQDNQWRPKYTDGVAGPSSGSASYAYPHARPYVNNHTKKSSVSADQIKEKIGDFLGTNDGADLPMYKDKPRYPSKQRGIFRTMSRMRWKRWAVLALILFLAWWFAASAIAWLKYTEVHWEARSRMVRKAFVASWTDYANYAWGKDEYSPISHEGKFLVRKKGSESTLNVGAGWLIVDGLDTAITMNCTLQVAQARKWIQTSLDFSKLDGEIVTFEATVRILGGLLSAHYLSTKFPHLAAQRDDDFGQKGEDLYIEKATDLAERLLGAFDSPTGLPYHSVNLNTSNGILSPQYDGFSPTSEAGTVQIELKEVAHVTGEPLYWTVAEKVMQTIAASGNMEGLIPTVIHPETGRFGNTVISIGSQRDSYYEYLLKQYLQTGEATYKEMWDEALQSIKRNLVTWSTTADFTILAERPEGLEGRWDGRMEHITCSLPGAIALATTGGMSIAAFKKQKGSVWGRREEENIVLAEELMKTCWSMYVYAPVGLAPEAIRFKIDDPPRRWKVEDSDWKQPRSNVDFEDAKSDAYKKKAPWRADLEIPPADIHHRQRPETVESLFYLWRITGKSVYRDWGWKIFRSLQDNTQVLSSMGSVTGYTSLSSVVKIPPRHLANAAGNGGVVGNMAADRKTVYEWDKMEGHWLSKTLKFLYLLFTEEDTDHWFDLTKIVINAHGHLLPRFDITGHSVFKTGWTRPGGKAS